MEEKKHVSEDERRKWVLIYVLIGILVAIFVVIVIIMIPKGNDDTGPEVYSSKVSDKMKENKNSVTNTEEEIRDKKKVSLKVSSVTKNGAVITITDENEDKYDWYPKFTLQEKVDGKWVDMEIKNPENMIFTNTVLPRKSDVTTQSIVWMDKYGSLDEGKYRVVKESDGTNFYAEFEIESD